MAMTLDVQAEGFVRVMDNAIRDQLHRRYADQARAEMRKVVEEVMVQFESELETVLKGLTLDQIQKSIETTSMADRLIVAFSFNKSTPEVIEP